MSLPMQLAIKSALSIARCVKPGQEQFCAGFGIGTPGRGEGGHRAAEWRIPIPCVSPPLSAPE